VTVCAHEVVDELKVQLADKGEIIEDVLCVVAVDLDRMSWYSGLSRLIRSAWSPSRSHRAHLRRVPVDVVRVERELEIDLLTVTPDDRPARRPMKKLAM
jgi:hypothetical protein